MVKFSLADAAKIGVIGLFAGLAAAGAFKKPDEPKSIDEKVESVQKVEQVDPWKKYELAKYPEYNALLPSMYKESKATGVPLDILAVTALTESQGKGGTRHEPGFQRLYVNHQFDKPTVFSKMYNDLSKQNPDLTLEIFKEQLASSTGPFQIMYLVAVERGFRGSFEELSKPEINTHFAAKHLMKKGVNKDTPMETALKIYNTGSATGTPNPGHLARAKSFCETLGTKYTK